MAGIACKASAIYVPVSWFERNSCLKFWVIIRHQLVAASRRKSSFSFGTNSTREFTLAMSGSIKNKDAIENEEPLKKEDPIENGCFWRDGIDRIITQTESNPTNICHEFCHFF